MAAEGIKPLASLQAGMLGRRGATRRVPLSFAPPPEDVEPGTAELPEVVLQVMRLAQALGVDTPVGSVDDLPQVAAALDALPEIAAETRRRIAFTLRLDADRHARLRALAATEGRSAQQLLTDALDRYFSTASTGTQP
jgi:hypothetical protein